MKHFILLSLLAITACQPPQYDVVILNGNVIDGTNQEAVQKDIGIIGDKIVSVGLSGKYVAQDTIDAAGLVVAPGFIDLHTHLEPIKKLPEAKSHVMQGVTTALGGPDGGGPWPFGTH